MLLIPGDCFGAGAPCNDKQVLSFLFHFFLEPDDSFPDSFNRFGAVSAARQVISQLIIAKDVTNPGAEVILNRCHMMIIGVITHVV